MANDDGWVDIPESKDDGWKDLPSNNEWKDIPEDHTAPMNPALSAGGNFASGITANLNKPLAAGAETLFDLAKHPIDTIQGNNSPSSLYQKHRQEYEDFFNKSMRDNPKTSVGSNIAGSVALGSVVPGSTAAQTVMGAAEGFGNSTDPTLTGKLIDTGIGAGTGYATGKVLGGLSNQGKNILNIKTGPLAAYWAEKAATDRAKSLPFYDMAKTAFTTGTAALATGNTSKLAGGLSVASGLGLGLGKKYGSTIASGAAKTADYFANKVPANVYLGIENAFEAGQSPMVKSAGQAAMNNFLIPKVEGQ